VRKPKPPTIVDLSGGAEGEPSSGDDVDDSGVDTKHLKKFPPPPHLLHLLLRNLHEPRLPLLKQPTSRPPLDLLNLSYFLNLYLLLLPSNSYPSRRQSPSLLLLLLFLLLLLLLSILSLHLLRLPSQFLLLQFLLLQFLLLLVLPQSPTRPSY